MHGRRQISADTALRLARYFGTSVLAESESLGAVYSTALEEPLTRGDMQAASATRSLLLGSSRGTTGLMTAALTAHTPGSRGQ